MGMNTDTGEFVREERIRSWMKTLSVGEVVKLKGEECQVTAIGERTVTLTLLSDEDRMRMEVESIAGNRHERRRKAALARKGSL